MPQPPPTSTKIEPQTEPWLRGTLLELPAVQRAILHALQLAQEDVVCWCSELGEQEVFARPHGLPPVSFHLRHIVGSLDRLLRYAEGGQLSAEQKQKLSAEMEPVGRKEEILAEFQRGLASAEARIRAVAPDSWPEARTVGRKQMPSTVAGLLIHCADHTQRHVGQAVTTAKLLIALRNQPA